MTDLHQKPITAESTRSIDELWLKSNVPAELAEAIAVDYDVADRQRLAQVAAQAAIAEVKEAYRDPFLTSAVNSAVMMALGIKPLPVEQGEQ